MPDATAEAATEGAAEPGAVDAAALATGDAAPELAALGEAAGEPAAPDATGEAADEAAGEPAAVLAAGDPPAAPDGHGVPVAPDGPGEPVGCGGMKVHADVRLPPEQAAASSRTAPDVSNDRMKGRFMFMPRLWAKSRPPCAVSAGPLPLTATHLADPPAPGPTGWPGPPPPLVRRRPTWKGCVGRGPRPCAR
jgi:hypothetical protein